MNKVIFNFRKKIILKIIYICCILNMPKLIGIILLITLKRIKKIKYKKKEGKIIYL